MLHSLTLDVRRSVGFIQGAAKINAPRERDLLGTGFFIDHYVGKVRHTFLVTARHLLNRRAEVADDDQRRYLLINDKNGIRRELPLPNRENWTQHPTTDVAVTPFTPPGDWDGYCHASQSLLARLKANELAIGEGTEVFFAGLFSGYSGGDSIEPICRFGHIALMPRKTLPLSFYPGNSNQAYAYLVEVLSHGGISGSPTFAPDAKNRLILIGLVSQHYELPAEIVTSSKEPMTELKVRQNAGIVVIIPGCEIMHTIDMHLSGV